jgi:hypothetical protein
MYLFLARDMGAFVVYITVHKPLKRKSTQTKKLTYSDAIKSGLESGFQSKFPPQCLQLHTSARVRSEFRNIRVQFTDAVTRTT